MLETKQNKNSIPPLIASIERDPRINDVDVEMFRVGEGGLVAELDNLRRIIQKTLHSSTKVVVGFTILTPQVKEVRDLALRLKGEFGDEVVLVAGGPHASGDPFGTIKVLGFDLAVVGEGERSFPDLVYALENDESLEKVKGIAFLEDGELKVTEKPEPINLDDYPTYSLKYRTFSPAIEIMRGCPYPCTFCQTPRLMGFRPRYRSVEKIVEIVEVYVREFNWRRIRFVAPVGFLYGSKDGRSCNLDRIEELLSSVRSVKGVEKVYLGTFPSETRPETISPETLNVVKKYASNKLLAIGLQSGSDYVLKKVGRGHDVEAGLKAIELAKEAGFTPYVDVIIGFPCEREEDTLTTLNLIKALAKAGIKVRLHTFMPLPGTPLWREVPAKIPTHVKEELKKLENVDGDYEVQEGVANEVIAWYKSEVKKISNGSSSTRCHAFSERFSPTY